ncbi:hypothetical protein [Bacillus phage YungSlug]|nr:hypothetical protein [Bacillus phage YungSlug]
MKIRKTQSQIREAWQGYTKNRNEFHSLTQINYSEETQNVLDYASSKVPRSDSRFINGFSGRIAFDSMWIDKRSPDFITLTPEQLVAYEQALGRWRKND